MLHGRLGLKPSPFKTTSGLLIPNGPTESEQSDSQPSANP